MARVDPVVVDFETEAIQSRPTYPPKPVGVAIDEPGHDPIYLAWGHPEGNNCSKADALKRLKPIWADARRDGGRPIAMHHAKFDLDVAETHLGLKLPPASGFEDTMFELFLEDPHSTTLALKPAAEKHLNLKPVERDAVRGWLIEHGIVSKQLKAKWGAFICQAPGTVVGRYAIGDVVRTGKLHRKLHKRVLVDRGMRAPYEREKLLLPILLAAERVGIPVDLRKLRADTKGYTEVLERADGLIRKLLKAPDLNVDENVQLGDALDRSRYVDRGAWLYTKPSKAHPSGQRSTAKASIDAAVTHAGLRNLLRYRAALATCLRTFMGPWLAQAEATGGIVHTTWNQVRQYSEGGDPTGARSGRLSSSPNFQNVPVRLFIDLEGHPLPIPTGFPELPKMRAYFIPPRGEAWLKRDYSQQEFRILGHYEDGELLREYLATPTMDVHDRATELINDMLAANFGRRQVKDIGFGLLYGMGIPKLAKKAGVDLAAARKLKRAYLSVFPGLKDLIDGLKDCAKTDEPMVTWGGRQYYCEEPRMVEGELRTFEYKMLNYLIQGSAADCTKEALIRYDAMRKHGTFRLTVHDEINVTTAKGTWQSEMKILRDAMASVEFDVPMLSDGSWSPRAWGEAKDIKE